MKKILFTTLLMFLLTLVSTGCETGTTEEPPQVIAFTKLDQTNRSSIQKPRFVTVRDIPTWQALWDEYQRNSQGIPAPVIDFASTMVLGVFLGMRPNTCYSVAIESVEQIAGQRLTVKYRETKPTGSAVCGQAITYPSHLVSVPASELSVEFVELQ